LEMDGSFFNSPTIHLFIFKKELQNYEKRI
jgi:hypothetical protein